MGSWNATCIITNLPILEGDKVRAFILNPKLSRKELNQSMTYCSDYMEPVGLSLQGTYNDYGNIHSIKETPASEILRSHFNDGKEHILDLEFLKGYGFKNTHGSYTIDDIVLAVERGCTPYNIVMVHEFIFQHMISSEGGDREMFAPKLNEIAEDILYAKEQYETLDGSERMMFGFRPPTKGRYNIFFGEDRGESAISCLVKMDYTQHVLDNPVDKNFYNDIAEHYMFNWGMSPLRKAWLPSSGGGSQDTSWKAHVEALEATLAFAKERLEEERKWSEEDE